METRNLLSALLMHSSEDNPIDTDFILESDENMGLSSLEKPHVIKVFQDPKEGIMWMLFEGADDYCELDADDITAINCVYNHLNN